MRADYSGQIELLIEKQKSWEGQEGKYLISNNNYLTLNAKSDKDTEVELFQLASDPYLRRMHPNSYRSLF